MVSVKLKGDTIPHDVFGQVRWRQGTPQASIAWYRLIGAAVSALVLEAAGVKNVLTSRWVRTTTSLWSRELDGLLQLRLSEDITSLRTK